VRRRCAVHVTGRSCEKKMSFHHATLMIRGPVITSRDTRRTSLVIRELTLYKT